MLTGKLQNSYSAAGYTAQKNNTAPKVNPANASYEEMMQLYQDLLAQGKVEEGVFDFLDKPENLEERSNYLEVTRAQKDAQRDSGDMTGYQQTLMAYHAMCSQIFGSKYIETEHGLMQAEFRSAELTSGILGLGGCGASTYYARYASNSTVENPIVEVCVENHRTLDKSTYFVDINSVDFEHAAEMDIFALLAHYEKQERTEGDAGLYEQGRLEGIFRAENLIEFLYEKQDWPQRLEEFSGSKISQILQEIIRDRSK